MIEHIQLFIHSPNQYLKDAIKLQESLPSERFIEILMYGGTAFNRFSAALNTNEIGYITLFDKNGVDGWSERKKKSGRHLAKVSPTSCNPIPMRGC